VIQRVFYQEGNPCAGWHVVGCGESFEEIAMPKRFNLNSSRILVLIGPIVLLSGLTVWNLCSPGLPPQSMKSSLQGEAAIKSLKDQGWYDSLAKAMAEARYELRENR
jgi:hypothetical protein